jgi:hypothetical protein
MTDMAMALALLARVRGYTTPPGRDQAGDPGLAGGAHANTAQAKGGNW